MAELSELQAIMDSTNFAEKLDQDLLDDMGSEIKKFFDMDEDSRDTWLKKYDEYIRLASQVTENKSFPWPNAANVKYPLLTIASMQFAARAYQALVPTNRVVKARTLGDDPDGAKLRRSRRVSNYMSYQVLEEMEDWSDSMDRLCLALPIVGNIFKKTYFDGHEFKSDLVLPKDLVVNYHAKDLESAQRKTHILYYHPNEVEERIRSKEFIDFDYMPETAGDNNQHLEATDEAHGLTEPTEDEDQPLRFLECHCWWDLDNDGYKEPYIITVHEKTKTVVRIVAGYDLNSVKTTEDGTIYKIDQIQYFTNFVFIPDPSSGIYGLGFGVLLGPLNEAANTIINQLIDSGTIHNLQSGFLAKGVKVPQGQTPFKPGEWRHINMVSDDLKKSVMPLPTKEPSTVLFQLLSMMLESGQQLSAVSNLMTGENPGQNQPFSTTEAVLNQGMQVFSSIFKRIHTSLRKEFKKLYRLNGLFLDEKKYFTVLDPTDPGDRDAQEIGRTDFADDIKVFPASDPRRDSEAEKMAKIQTLMSLLQLGTINPAVVTKRILEAQDHEGIDQLMQMPPPQPSPEMQLEQAKLELEKERLALEKMKIEGQLVRDKAAAQKTSAEAAVVGSDMEMKKFDAMQKMLDMQHDKDMKALDMQGKQQDQMHKSQAAGEKLQNDMLSGAAKRQFEKEQHAEKLEQERARTDATRAKSAESSKPKPSK